MTTLGFETLSIDSLFGLSGFLVLALVLRWHRKLSAAIEPSEEPRAARDRYPSITMIRPVRGKDVGAAENFAAALDTGRFTGRSPCPRQCLC